MWCSVRISIGVNLIKKNTYSKMELSDLVLKVLCNFPGVIYLAMTYTNAVA